MDFLFEMLQGYMSNYESLQGYKLEIKQEK